MTRVVLLYGGVSGEHEVSMRSAASVEAGLVRAGMSVSRIYIARDGTWHAGGPGGPALVLPAQLVESLARGRADGEGVSAHIQAVLEGPPVFFPVLHGTLGEDGTVQGFLELLEVPYVGAGVLGSALGMDKIAMKKVLQWAGIPVAPFVEARRCQLSSNPEVVIKAVEERLGYPCFVKPANLGSSVGVSKAHSRDELAAALELAAEYDRRIIVEKGLDAREIEVSVLGNDEPTASVPGEVIPGREFYDYVAKYGQAGSRTIVPAHLPENLAERSRELAIRAFRELDLAGMARVDFLLERRSEELFLNEVNTIPGFTEISMYAKLWEASGLPFERLLARLIELAQERYRDRQKSLSAARRPIAV